MTTLTFIVPDELKSVLRAAGADAPTEAIEPCPLHVGDVIAYPGPVALAVRVASRAYFPEGAGKPGRWYVRLEAAPHPLDA